MRYELHAHTCFSDGCHTPAQMVAAARAKGLAGIVITDHDTCEGARQALPLADDGFTVTAGIEVSSSAGHILGIDVHHHIPQGMSPADTVEAIHAAGGFAVAAHPFDRYRSGVGELIHAVPFDAVEAFNGHTFGNTCDPVAQAEKAGLPVVGGSDAHSTAEVGLVTVECEGPLMPALREGRVVVRQRHPLVLFANHGVGLVKRKLTPKRGGQHR